MPSLTVVVISLTEPVASSFIISVVVPGVCPGSGVTVGVCVTAGSGVCVAAGACVPAGPGVCVAAGACVAGGCVPIYEG